LTETFFFLALFAKAVSLLGFVTGAKLEGRLRRLVNQTKT
jgi:hypothetical protein